MGLSPQQETILAQLFIGKVPHPTDSIRTFIESFMEHTQDIYHNTIIKDYLIYLKKNDSKNWYEDLVKSCPHDNSYIVGEDENKNLESKKKFLNDIKAMKKDGHLSDYKIAKIFMQQGNRRLIKNAFIMNAYKHCEEEYKALYQKRELNINKEMTLILMKIIFFTNSLSGVNQTIIKICTGAKDKLIKFGTPRKSDLAPHALFAAGSMRKGTYLKMNDEISPSMGLLQVLDVFKLQFDSCKDRKPVAANDLSEDFWNENDTIIVLIDRLIKLLEQYQAQKGANVDEANKIMLEDFLKKIKEFQLFFFSNQDNFFNLYNSLVEDEKQVASPSVRP